VAVTTRTDVFKPKASADKIMTALVKELQMLPFVHIDDTLEKRAGDSITVPEWDFIGASSVPSVSDDAIPISFEGLSYTDQTAIVKKTRVGIAITDEALLGGEEYISDDIHKQLATAIAVTVESEVVACLNTTPNVRIAGGAITYNSLLQASAQFTDVQESRKVLFIAPSQFLQVAQDSRFQWGHEYVNVSKGEIGNLAGVHIVPSFSVDHDATVHFNNMIALNKTENDLPAITIYLKRDLNMEVERVHKNRTWEFSADLVFAVALTNPIKVMQIQHNI